MWVPVRSSQTFEEAFGLFTNNIRIGVCDYFFSYMGKAEQGILLGDQFVYMLFVKYICPTVLNCFQQVAHIPFFIHEKHSYGIQSRQLYAVCQQRA